MPEPKTTLTYTHADLRALVEADAEARGLIVTGLDVQVSEGQMGRGPTTVAFVLTCDFVRAPQGPPPTLRRQ